MFKLTSILLFFIATSVAKIIENEIKLFSVNKKLVPLNPWDVKTGTQCKLQDKLWVLTMSDEASNFKRLYLANQAEEKIFKKVMAPAIRNYETSGVVKRNDHSKMNDSDKVYEPASSDDALESDIKNEILVIINKFFLNNMDDPSMGFVVVPTNQEQRSLKLYFKGPYTSLIMSSGRKIYQYFMNPPSPLVEWFYKNHENIILEGNDKYVEIPENVRQNFMKQILNSLKTYFSYPV